MLTHRRGRWCWGRLWVRLISCLRGGRSRVRGIRIEVDLEEDIASRLPLECQGEVVGILASGATADGGKRELAIADSVVSAHIDLVIDANLHDLFGVATHVEGLAPGRIFPGVHVGARLEHL